MNNFRAHKFKLSSKNNNLTAAERGVNNGNNNNTNNSNGRSFLTRFKRYSTLGNKLRRGNSPHKCNSPPKLATGSYNMTGSHSEDHRLEIGAPILISTTTLNTDRFGVTEARLKQIGGGIAVHTTLVRALTPTDSAQSSPQLRSSGSEHDEDFVDAISTIEKPHTEAEIEPEQEHFETPSHTPASTSQPHTSPPPLPVLEAPLIDNILDCYEIVAPEHCLPLSKQQQSQSVQNLHRSALKFFLHTSSSTTLDMNATAPELSIHFPELYDRNVPSLTSQVDIDTYYEKNVSLYSTHIDTPANQVSNVSNSLERNESSILGQQQNFRSTDSFQLPATRHQSQRYNSHYGSQTSSKQSLTSCRSDQLSQGSAFDDFDLKSVSYQSLHAQNLFVSIDELNEITRQINESEDFNKEIDLEYCAHRDQLRPSERRITLLKNKNSHLISFNHNKEKFRKGFLGMKHWLGEETTRLKEAVRQQTTLKRIATSRMNLNQFATAEDLGRQSSAPDEVNSKVIELCESCEDVTDEPERESSILQRASVEDLSSNAKQFKDEGQNGFEELRRYVKQGGDFSKELILVLQERTDTELIYSKSLSKMANKLNKACRELPGSIADAWRGVATEMESRSDIHRQLAASLTDELVKPLKSIVDSHHKSRKSVENNVDKAARVLSEWRASEAKAKKASHTAARENEKLQDAMLDVRIQKSPSIALLHQGPNKQAAEKELKSAEKDCAKLDNKRKKAEEAVKRADVEYYTLCVRAERARVDWEMSVLRGSVQLQSSEQQRLASMQSFVETYTRLAADMSPILGGLITALKPQLETCNVAKDMQVVRNIRCNSEGPSEQLLPDFYCEHTTLAMNRERRKHALIKLLQLVKTDLERERRSRDGLRGLSQSLNNQENQNITDKLYHIRSMLTYLEGARLKLHSALLQLDHKPRTTHPLAQHIQITRDRTGLQQSILKVPNWLKNNDKAKDTPGEDSPLNNNNNSSYVNISEATSSKSLLKHFSRSKSNIENFTSQPKIISATSPSPTAIATKSKTLSTNLISSDRGQADGGSNQQDSDSDEFSSQDEDEEQGSHLKQSQLKQQAQSKHFYQNAQQLQKSLLSSGNTKDSAAATNSSLVLSRCKALYSYTPKLYDELELNPGDMIEVHAKQDDGWWLGALRNQVGIFPATYVEECA